MALPSPYTVPLTGPNGTFQIPSQLGPVFGLPEFGENELADAGLGPVPRVTEPPPPAPVLGPPLPPRTPGLEPPPGSPIAPAPPRSMNAGLAPPPAAPAPAPAPRQARGRSDATLDPFGPEQPPPEPGTIAHQLGVIDERRDIARQLGEAESAAAREEAAIYDASAAEEARLEKERQVQRDAANKEIAAARAKQASALDAYVNHKVDQNRLWHNMSTGSKIMAGIGVALAGLGGALVARDTGRPVQNTALDMIMGAIQDDVRLQLADRDTLGQVAGMRRDSVNDLRQQFQDGEAQYQALVAGNTRRVANQIAAAGARAKDESVKIRAKDHAALLNGEADKIMLEAQEREAARADRAFQQRMQKSQLGLGWANYNRDVIESDRQFDEGKRRFDAELDLKKADLEAASKAALAKGGAEAQKQYREDIKEAEQRGLNDPSTGEPILQPEGVAMVERAKEIEQVAAKQKDPAVAEALRSQASALRGEARVKHVVKGRTPEKAADLSQAYAAALTAHGLLSDIKALRGKAGWEADVTKTPEYQAMRSRYAAAKAVTGKALQLGSMDEGTNAMLDELFGGDPTAWKSTEAAIDGSIAMLEQRTGNLLRSDAGWRGAEGFKFPSSSNPAATQTAADTATKKITGEKTPEEVAQAGRTGKLFRSVMMPLGGETPKDKAAAEKGLSTSSWTIPGVTEAQGKELDALAAQAKSSDPKLSQQARSSLVSLAGDKRAGISTGALATMASAGMVDELTAVIEKLPLAQRRTVEAIWLPRAKAAASGVEPQININDPLGLGLNGR